MCPFDLQASSSDQHQLVRTEEGQEIPYGVWRFEELVKECWYISDNIHTSYNEILDITPREKSLLIKFINNKFKAEKEALDRAKKNRK